MFCFWPTKSNKESSEAILNSFSVKSLGEILSTFSYKSTEAAATTITYT